MAHIVHTPGQHACEQELAEFATQPDGTVVECSCGKRYIRSVDPVRALQGWVLWR